MELEVVWSGAMRDTYTIDLDDEMVELLAAGVCPEDVSRICFGLLKWKREHARNEARRSA